MTLFFSTYDPQCRSLEQPACSMAIRHSHGNHPPMSLGVPTQLEPAPQLTGGSRCPWVIDSCHVGASAHRWNSETLFGCEPR